MSHAHLHIITGSLTILVIALALLNWNYTPENANSWIAALITMPLIWLCAGFMMKFKSFEGISEIMRKFFTSSVISAGLLLAFSLIAKLTGNLMEIDASLIKRAREVFMGLVLLYFSNMVPKFIGPSLIGKCSNAVANSVRRFSGWVMVFGALGYIGAWIFTPLLQASNIAHGSVICAIFIVALRVLIAIIGGAIIGGRKG